MADIVLWRPEYFGAKPQLVLKAGFPAYGVTGDPNPSTDSCQPLVLGPLFAAMARLPPICPSPLSAVRPTRTP